MQEVIKYLDNLKNKDEFTKSVIKQFQTKGEKSLSNKQIEILTDKWIQHRTISNYFETKKDKTLSEFEKSLRDFFEKNGFLTENQQKALFKKRK